MIPARAPSSALLVALLGGCRGGPPPQPVPHTVEALARPAAPTVVAPAEETFQGAAVRFYAQLAAPDLGGAAATLRSLERFDRLACLGGGWLQPDGATVAGARALVTFDAAGRAVQIQTFEGCLLHAEPPLFVETLDDRTLVTIGSRRFVAHSASWGTAKVTSGWVLAGDGDGAVAVSRSRAATQRLGDGPGGAPGAPRGVDVAGRFLVVEGADGALRVQRDDLDGAPPVRGCQGRLLGAASVSVDEVVVHTGMDDPADPAQSQLCWVTARGATRTRVALGTATCGLARAVPCAWQLQVVTPTILGFGSMRGMLKTIDPRTGAQLPWTLPPGYRTEGGSPSGFGRCAEGLCASVIRDDGELALVVGTRSGDAVRFAPRPATELPYCDVHGLPVPRALCATLREEK